MSAKSVALLERRLGHGVYQKLRLAFSNQDYGEEDLDNFAHKLDVVEFYQEIYGASNSSILPVKLIERWAEQHPKNVSRKSLHMAFMEIPSMKPLAKVLARPTKCMIIPTYLCCFNSSSSSSPENSPTQKTFTERLGSKDVCGGGRDGFGEKVVDQLENLLNGVKEEDKGLCASEIVRENAFPNCSLEGDFQFVPALDFQTLDKLNKADNLPQLHKTCRHRYEAEDLLEDKCLGSYLVRHSNTSIGHLAISVRVPARDGRGLKTVHIMIYSYIPDGAKDVLYTINHLNFFKTRGDLIVFYRSNYITGRQRLQHLVSPDNDNDDLAVNQRT